MIVIKPSAEIIPTNKDPMKHIEQIGRVCYKSEDRITDDSAPKFVKMINERGHWAMLENYIFIMSIPKMAYRILSEENPKYINMTEGAHGYVVSFSARSLLDLRNETESNIIIDVINTLINNIVIEYDCRELFSNVFRDKEVWGYEGNYQIITMEEAMIYFTATEKLAHCWVSTKWICDRGVSHELVRHEGQMSFAQESTRYCNYTNNKFCGEVTFIQPFFWEPESAEDYKWRNCMAVCESIYKDLVAMGAQPQEARSVLPNSLKTEVCITGRFKEWLHFFELRTDKPAHPQMREVATPLLREFKNRWPDIFSEIEGVD